MGQSNKVHPLIVHRAVKVLAMAPHMPTTKRDANRISSVIKASVSMSIAPMIYCIILKWAHAIGAAMLIAHANRRIAMAQHQKAAAATVKTGIAKSSPTIDQVTKPKFISEKNMHRNI